MTIFKQKRRRKKTRTIWIIKLFITQIGNEGHNSGFLYFGWFTFSSKVEIDFDRPYGSSLQSQEKKNIQCAVDIPFLKLNVLCLYMSPYQVILSAQLGNVRTTLGAVFFLNSRPIFYPILDIRFKYQRNCIFLLFTFW